MSPMKSTNPMKPKPKFSASGISRLTSVIFAGVLTTPHVLQAATLTWDTASGDGESITAGSGDWNTTATNWNNAGVNEAWSQTSATAASHAAVFGGSDGTYAVTLSGTVNAQSVTFNNSGYTLSGGTLILRPTSTTNGGITVAADKTATINSLLQYSPNAAATNVINAGATLNLGGGASNSQYTFNGAGSVNITGGSYEANIGAINVGSFNISGGTYNITPGGTNGYTFGAAVARNVNVNVSGTGTLTLNNTDTNTAATAPFIAIGNNTNSTTHTTSLTVQSGGTVTIGGNQGARAAEIRISNSGNANGLLDVQGGTVTVGTGNANNKIYLFKNGATAGYSSSMTQSGGTVTTNGIQFGGATGTYEVGSAANLTLSGGSLFIGAQGITRGTGATDLPTAIKLQGGILGASDTWSSSLDMKLGTTGGGLTIQAATSGGVSKDITLSGILSDDTSVNGTLTKTGIGTVTISGANTYSGNTSINAGTLKLGAAGVIADGTGKGNVAIGASGTLDLNGFSEAINGLSGAGTVDNTAAGTATLTVGTVAGGNFSGTIKNTGGALSLVKTGNTDVILSGTNTYSGTTTINQNRLFITNSAALSANTAVTVNNGGALVLNAGGTPTYAQSITLNSGSNLSMRSAATLSNVTLATSGIVTFNQDDSATQALTLNSATALGGELVVQVGGGSAAPAAVTLSGIFSGSGGSLVKIGSGTLSLGGANTFDGGLTIRNGTVNAITNNNALGAGGVSLGGAGSTGASLLTGRTLANTITVNAPDSGSVVIGANGGGSGYTLSGGITLNGNLTLQTFDNTINGAIKAGGTITGGITGTGNVVLNNLGLAANTLTFNTGAINHTGSLTLQGAATGDTTINASVGLNVTSVTQNSATSRLILAGNNTYSGVTNINAGTLVVTGSTATSSMTTVDTGATLMGSGTVGALTINSGGTLAPGTSIESLASGDLTLLAGAIYQQEIDKSKAGSNDSGDLLAVTGSLTLALGNDSILNLIELGASGAWSMGDKITLISYSGAWNGGLFTYNDSVLSNDSTFTFSDMEWLFKYDDTAFGDNYVTDLTGPSFVTMTAIPEPSAALLGGLGLLALLRRRRN